MWPSTAPGTRGRGKGAGPGLSDAPGLRGRGEGRDGRRAPLPPVPQPPAFRAPAPPRSCLPLTGIFSLPSVEWWNVFTLSFLELGLRRLSPLE